MSDVQTGDQGQAAEVQVDTLTATEFDVAYIDKRGSAGLPPGVHVDSTQSHQSVNPQDPGLPRAPEVQNKRPEAEATVDTDAEKAKIAEAENAEAANKAAEEAATPEDAAAADAEENKKLVENAEYESYGHAGVDAAVDLLKSSGIDPKDAAKWFAPILETRDVNSMDFTAMEKALGKTNATLVASAVKDFMGQQMQSIQTTAAEVTKIFGGAENLSKVGAWIKASRSQEVADLYQLLDKGGVSARLASEQLTKLYNADPNNKSLTITRVDGDSTPKPQGQATLTRAEYHSEMKKAQAAGDQQRIAELRRIRGAQHARK